ncbi:RidA family protein [Aestuariirhabdus litorea]|uniref:RidA family protein n=1 Tax=Aestuariirhabdus litorea TaxID=2528527 RepID=A0A3P3VPY1_9GAMM|nr:RidA family protein [Aestuariirhabdus litorea]RRJ82873.1 RidA family protein [Aestuariirhabdus litorea]RWW93032.1 RidA family protein [Endozoicomonadaceae bacterium GTF-13]
MSIDRYQTSARMSKIVVHNQTVYLCGQVAEDRSADITHQTQTMLAKVDELLQSVGSSREKMLSATVYLKSMEDFAAMNAVWDAWVPEGYAPARACVEAAMASPELKVEISVTAAL